MKHSIIITVIASLMLCLSLPTDAQRHRHHPGATTTTTKVDNKATQKADSANAIEAFSDTTSAVADVDTTSTNATYTCDISLDLGVCFRNYTFASCLACPYCEMVYKAT